MKYRILNIITGLSLVVLSIIHIMYGETQIISALKKVTSDGFIIGSVRVMSVQGGVLLLFVGFLHILISARFLKLIGFAGYIPLLLIVLNISTVLVITISLHNYILNAIVPQLIIFGVIIIMQLFIIKTGKSLEKISS